MLKRIKVPVFEGHRKFLLIEQMWTLVKYSCITTFQEQRPTLCGVQGSGAAGQRGSGTAGAHGADAATSLLPLNPRCPGLFGTSGALKRGAEDHSESSRAPFCFRSPAGASKSQEAQSQPLLLSHRLNNRSDKTTDSKERESS